MGRIRVLGEGQVLGKGAGLECLEVYMEGVRGLYDAINTGGVTGKEVQGFNGVGRGVVKEVACGRWEGKS